MKIFSNFDTQAPLEHYQKALAEYGADKVIFVRRHRIYLLFFVTLPCIAIGVLFIAAFFFGGMCSASTLVQSLEILFLLCFLHLLLLWL